MKEIREAILEKVRAEARDIIERAEEDASRIVAEAEARRGERLAAEKEERLRHARNEAAQITARGAMDARNTVAAAKAAVFEDIVGKARERVREGEPAADEYARLIAEAVAGLGGGDGITLAVPPGRGDIAAEALKKDERLRECVSEVEERAMDGGLIAQSENGSTVVDNTYDARLEMLLPRIYVGFAVKLFGGEES